MKNIKLYMTARDTGHRLSEVQPLPLDKGEASAEKIRLCPDTRYQTLLGFGGAFTEAAGYTFSRMGEENRRKIIELYYDKETGLGYDLGRMAIGSSDFALGVYDYVTPGDKTLESFDMSHEDNWVIPMIKAAEAHRGKPVVLLVTPWSPPAYMKDNQNKLQGGRLLRENYELCADYYAKFIAEARKKGLTIEYMSVQNEPDAKQTWDSCLFSPEEEGAFVKCLAASLEKFGVGDVKLLIHDHNRDILLQRVLPQLGDPEVAKHVWGTAIHWYVKEDFEAVRELHERHPDKHIFFTEGCPEGGLQLGSWDTGERYGRNISGDLNAFTEAWVEWNLVLDETGGPNHVGNFCDALIVCDTRSDTITLNSSYYYMGHFSKFVKAGAQRIGCEHDGSLLTFAARGPSGEVVAVVQNHTDGEIRATIELGDESALLALPPHSIVTAII